VRGYSTIGEFFEGALKQIPQVVDNSPQLITSFTL